MSRRTLAFLFKLVARAELWLENSIAAGGVFPRLSPSHSPMELRRWLAGISLGHREPYSSNAVGTQRIDAVADHSVIVHTLPELDPSTQHIGGKGLIFPGNGTELLNPGFTQLRWVKFQIHRRIRVQLVMQRR
jgi:hypothetical protein